MQPLIEEFLVHLRHERGAAEHTQRTYKLLLDRFAGWAEKRRLTVVRDVQFSHLMEFLEHERSRPLAEKAAKGGTGRLSSESLYLQIAALRAFFRFAEAEGFVAKSPAGNLSLPRRWKHLPKVRMKSSAC
jgi:site-specific recombinase XerD